MRSPSLVTTVRLLGRGLIDLVAPPVCLCCNLLSGDLEHGLCASCIAALTADLHAACPRCGCSVGPNAHLAPCSRCRGESLAFAGVVRMSVYEGRLREVILRMKHRRGEILAWSVARLWAETIASRVRDWQAQAVVPVPLHRWRYWQRGFNQAQILACCLAKHLKLRCISRALRRTRSMPHQFTMPTRTARRKNVAGAFTLSRFARIPERVILVDDVMTTGATVQEAARALKAQAKKVFVAVVARDE